MTAAPAAAGRELPHGSPGDGLAGRNGPFTITRSYDHSRPGPGAAIPRSHAAVRGARLPARRPFGTP